MDCEHLGAWRKRGLCKGQADRAVREARKYQRFSKRSQITNWAQDLYNTTYQICIPRERWEKVLSIRLLYRYWNKWSHSINKLISAHVHRAPTLQLQDLPQGRAPHSAVSPLIPRHRFSLLFSRLRNASFSTLRLLLSGTVWSKPSERSERGFGSPE